MKHPKEKDGPALLRFGKRCWGAKQTLSAADYKRWKTLQPQLRHEAHPERVVTELDRRYIRLAKMQVLWRNEHKLPNTGIAALRELSKLSEEKLAYLFAANLIGPSSTRSQIDSLRTAQHPRGRAVAPRHRPRAA